MKIQETHFDSIGIHHLHQPVSGIIGYCLIAEYGCIRAMKRQIYVGKILKHAF